MDIRISDVIVGHWWYSQLLIMQTNGCDNAHNLRNFILDSYSVLPITWPSFSYSYVDDFIFWQIICNFYSKTN